VDWAEADWARELRPVALTASDAAAALPTRPINFRRLVVSGLASREISSARGAVLRFSMMDLL
jgi:hypothetical protein